MSEEPKKVFELRITSSDAITGVYAIGLVTSPAIEKNFVAFSKKPDKAQVSFSVNSDKRIVTGPVLIPNQYIYRRDSRGEYYVFMSESTIAQIVEKFHKGGFAFNTTHQHQFPLFNNSVVESWLVKDPTMDKAVLLGYEDLVPGTWMLSIKVEDEAYWQDYIKTGELKGFSIEGIFDEFFVNEELSNQVKQANNEKFMIAFGQTYKLADGTAITINEDYTVSKEDGSLLPDGYYELEDGTAFEVYYTYLAYALFPVWEAIDKKQNESTGMLSKVKQLLGLSNKANRLNTVKETIKESANKQFVKVNMAKPKLSKTKFSDVTTVDGVVVSVDDSTNRVDVVDETGMVVGYLEFVPAEQSPAEDSTAQSEDTPVADPVAAEMQAMREQMKALIATTTELAKKVNGAVPNKVVNDKRDFETDGQDALNSFLKARGV